MDDMIGGVPPSINVGHMNARFHHLSKNLSTSYTNALLENDHQNNLLEGMMMSSTSNGAVGASNSKAELPFVPTMTTTASSNAANSASKRTLSSLYWNDHEDVVAAGTSSSNKRFNLESGDHSVVRTDHQENGTTVTTSFATLLNQLPQTPSSLHQQTMLGSIGDGLLRAPYQIPGMNWYG